MDKIPKKYTDEQLRYICQSVEQLDWTWEEKFDKIKIWFQERFNDVLNYKTWDSFRKLYNLAKKNLKEIRDVAIELEVNWEHTTFGAELRNRIMTLEDLLTQTEVDLDEYEVTRYKVNKWEQNSVDEWITQLIQVKADLARKQVNPTEIKREFLEDMKNLSPHTEKIEYKETPLTWEINLADLHFGKVSAEEESTEEYVAFLKKKIIKTMEYFEHMWVSEAIVAINGDLLNADGVKHKTTKGTDQDMQTPYRRACKHARKFLVWAIDMIAKKYKTKVIIIEGNHDEGTMFMIWEVLEGWYHNNPNVEVDNSDNPRKYHKFGKNLIWYTHGKFEKPDKFATLILSECRKELHDVEFIQGRMAHLHSTKKFVQQTVNEFNGIEIITLKSPTSEDRYHQQAGYTWSLRQIDTFLWDKEAWCIGNFRF